MQNYFELYEIPVSLKPAQDQLKKKFYELTQQYHPGLLPHLSEQEQAVMLEKTALINKAWRVFQHTDETIYYVLKLKNLINDEEKYELDRDFLVNVLRMKEDLALIELEHDDTGLVKVAASANALLDEIYKDAEPVLENYEDGITTEKELLQVKDYYFKKKYLQRILDKITQIRNIASP